MAYNSRVNYPIPVEVTQFDDSPALNTLPCQTSVVLTAPPTDNRKWQVLLVRAVLWQNWSDRGKSSSQMRERGCRCLLLKTVTFRRTTPVWHGGECRGFAMNKWIAVTRTYSVRSLRNLTGLMSVQPRTYYHAWFYIRAPPIGHTGIAQHSDKDNSSYVSSTFTKFSRLMYHAKT